MSLYQLTKEWQALYDQIENIPEDAFQDTLEAIEGEFDDKVDNIACFIKDLDAEADKIKEERDALKQREDAKRTKANRLREYLKDQMIAIGKKKVETPRNLVTLAKSAPRVETDEEFIAWAEKSADFLLNYEPPKPNKKAIQQAIKDGVSVMHVRLENRQALRIK